MDSIPGIVWGLIGIFLGLVIAVSVGGATIFFVRSISAIWQRHIGHKAE